MQQLNEVFQRSTVHGLAHAANSHSRLGQLFWATLCVGGLLAFVYNVSFTLDHFYSLPLLTSYFSNSELMEWPDVTLCNQVPVTLSSQNTLDKWQKALDNASQYETSEDLFTFFKLFRDKNVNDSEIGLEDQVLVNLTLALSTLHLGTVEELKKNIIQIGYNTGQRAISLNMQIDANIESLQIDSSNQTGVLTASTYFGRYRTPCMTLRTSRIFERDAHRSLQALFFFLLNDFDSYMHFNSAYFHQGTRLYLHDPDTLPTDDGILIVPGHSQRINFKAVVTHLLKQKRNCREQEFYEYMYDTSLQETRRIKLDYSLCKVLVSARKYHSRCRCYTPFLPAFKFDDSKPQLCFNMSVFNSSQLIQNALCLAEVHKEYSNEELFKATIDRECAHVKEVLCVRTEYNIESSDYMWPELWSEKMNSARKQLMQTVATNIVSRKYPDWTFDEQLEFVQNNMSIKELSQLLRTDCSDAHIKARSVYSDKVVESIEFPFSQLMSDIGGQLGLYLGVSIVGLFEVVEIAQAIVATLCRFVCMRRRLRRDRRGRQQQPVLRPEPALNNGGVSPSTEAPDGGRRAACGNRKIQHRRGEELLDDPDAGAARAAASASPVPAEMFANLTEGELDVEMHPMNQFGSLTEFMDD